ncbi:TPA: hypothetical protein N0F65_003715 [Lagenidium giganteum]|uniref:Uncharacterized protein n=1 Tax=Lagenidium giganteum TaxID=4803 RepID=A0AAV2Z394_9STRA|nr:TPA: hypothetical protein N0F65_003715 [Lagenidium giganteum]
MVAAEAIQAQERQGRRLSTSIQSLPSDGSDTPTTRQM